MAVFLNACRTTPRIYDYPALGFKIIEADSWSVAQACKGATHYDDGRPILDHFNIRACTVYGEHFDTIWIQFGDAEVIVHELCHADGTKTKKECGNVYWK